MLKKTHIVAAMICTYPIVRKVGVYSIIGLLGATAPDIDYKIGLEHRKSTHSLISLIISSSIIYLINHEIALIWFVAYLSHLILDSFTKMGVPLLYPINDTYIGFKIIKTGSAEELLIFLFLIYFAVSIILY